ncbi:MULTISPECIES: MFS transporter [Pseudomonas]|uniref:MFS-type transporter n=2 Tax=Pseudomonas chlororaphis TaxID=587753 RepID=A0AAD0ZIJ3_9PSED|nr:MULTISPECIES: MFS transporter [Pseudomonas]AIC21090.1 MFS transporter [Pseudomonas chlororaphis]AZD93621.1 putative MFS-type transporter [Pseudomonas chlororaphis subsp. aureofaciens]AZD99924.1 putative MFS-type transporter [Pseudomonas chlororaphis subsp. aureofaciens]AZE24525.1 putative MFS-type transporter [Pseudomonas chlororaphis subsp. aureofaciens]AZE30810.1 putative MFS-type transporter [Pseudomonas chlororaphis subsp. aureofaciens]
MTEPLATVDLLDIESRRHDRLPLSGLLALATAGFITILTEAMPAGLLPQMSQDLAVSPALVGQLVTLYAIGSLLAAIPLVILTQGWRRRPLLMIAIGGFALVNSVTAFSTQYSLILVARFFAGIFAGLLWALLAGYASRMVAPHLQGRAIAVAMLGAPLALSLGVPAGTLLGALVGWRASFALMTVLTLVLLGWVRWQVPDFPGLRSDKRLSLKSVFALPGVKPVLFVTFAYVLGHNILYTYIAPLLEPAGITGQIDRVLLVFGLTAVLSIWVVGLLIDRWLRRLVLVSCILFGLCALLLALRPDAPAAVYASMVLWGLSYGGLGTLLQTALAKTSGSSADAAQSMLVTAWNLAIAGGGLVGGILLEGPGVLSFPWVIIGLLLVCLVVVVNARRHGFPAIG